MERSDSIQNEHLHFITGRLAETSLRETLATLAEELGFRYSIQVMPITVAALLTPRWMAARLELPAEADADHSSRLL